MTVANTRVTQVLLKRGNTTRSNLYTGPLSELTHNTDDNSLRIHDGARQGGWPIATGAEIDDINARLANVSLGNIDLSNYATLAQLTANTYSNANVASYLLGTVTTGNIIPQANVLYSLGSPTNQWQSLYLSSNTIFIGGQVLSITSGYLSLNGDAVSGNYGNANVAAYLPTDTIIVDINANIAAANSAIATKTTSTYVNGAISTAINNLINSAPGTLDTLGEIAANLANQGSAVGVIIDSLTFGNTQLQELSANLGNFQSYANSRVDTGNLSFIDDSMYDINGIIIENADLSHGSTSSVIIPVNGASEPLQVNNLYGPVNITSGPDIGNTKIWSFGTNGQLQSPQGGAIGDTYSDGLGIGLSAGPGADDYAIINSHTGAQYVEANETAVYIGTNYPDTNTVWAFNKDGSVQFPDSTVQTTAWLGNVDAVAAHINFSASAVGHNPGNGTITFADGSIQNTAFQINATNNPPAYSGLWYNTDDGRTYLKYNDTWVDANPTVAPAPSYYLGNLSVDGDVINFTNGTLTVDPTGNLLVNGNLVSGSSGPTAPVDHLVIRNSNDITLDGGSAVWNGTLNGASIFAGFQSVDTVHPALFTFSTSGSTSMSVQLDGTLVVGDTMPSNASGITTDNPGWIVASGGIKLGGDINTLGGMGISSGITWTGGSTVFEDTVIAVQGAVGVAISAPGTTVITANTSQWTFDVDGNLRLPTNMDFISSPAVATSGIVFADGTYQYTASTGGTANTGNITFSGSDITGTGSNVTLTADTTNWVFDNTGLLTLPAGGVITDINGPIVLQPVNGTDANQQLKIYPTFAEGNHIHLTSGDLSVTDIFLGSDAQYIRTRTDGGMTIGAGVSVPDDAGSGHQWTFAVDGSTTFPDNQPVSMTGNVVTGNVTMYQLDGRGLGNGFAITTAAGSQRWFFDGGGTLFAPGAVDVGGSLTVRASAPSSATGGPGDYNGQIRVDNDYIYRATGSYVDQHYTATAQSQYVYNVYNIDKGSYPQPQLGWLFSSLRYGNDQVITGVSDNGSTWGISIDGVIANNGTVSADSNIVFYNPVYPTIWETIPFSPFGTPLYSNVNVAAYLPTSSVIIGINANVAGANAAIVTANTAMKSYVDSKSSTYSNTNVAAYLASQNITSANIGAYQTWANATFATSTTVQTLSANVGAYEIWANANAASQQTSITNIQNQITSGTVSTANVAYYTAGLATVSDSGTYYPQLANVTSGNALSYVSTTFAIQPNTGNVTVGNLKTDNSTFSLVNNTPATVNAFGNATTINIGKTGGTTTFAGNLAVGGVLQIESTQEAVAQAGSVTGNVNINFVTSAITYVTPTGNINANIQNLNITANTVTSVTVWMNQGATPYYLNNCYINGASQTINWQAGVTPTPNASKKDIYSLSIFNNAGTYVVLGQLISFG